MNIILLEKGVLTDTNIFNEDIPESSQIIETEQQNMLSIMEDYQDKVIGLILGESSANLVNAIRKGWANPWLPIAIISKNDVYLPFGCNLFSADENNKIINFILNPIKPKLLIIEDNKDLQDILFQALSRVYELTLCSDGKEGLRLIKNEKFDLIITDFMLPNMNGDEILVSVKNEKITTPVVVVTELDSNRLELNLLKSGASEYLKKPLSISVVRKTIINVLTGQQQQQAISGYTEKEDQLAWDQWKLDKLKFFTA